MNSLRDRIMSDICSHDNFTAALKTVLSRRKDLEQPRNGDILVDTLRDSVRRGCFSPSPARVVRVRKPDDSWREIAMLDRETLIVHTAVNNVLQRIWEPRFPANSYAFRPGLSIMSAIETLCRLSAYGFCQGIKADIEGFFDNVDHHILLEQFQSSFSDASFCRLIEVLLRQPVKKASVLSITKRGLVQGAPLSPLLSNIYLYPVDLILSRSGKVIRYADDFLFMGRSADEASDLFKYCSRTLQSLKLQFKAAKTEHVFFKKGFVFLGYSVNHDICIPVKYIESLMQ